MILEAEGCLSFLMSICEGLRGEAVLAICCGSSKTIIGVFCCWWLSTLQKRENGDKLVWLRAYCCCIETELSRYLCSGGESGNSGFCSLTGSSRGPNILFLSSPFSLAKRKKLLTALPSREILAESNNVWIVYSCLEYDTEALRDFVTAEGETPRVNWLSQGRGVQNSVINGSAMSIIVTKTSPIIMVPVLNFCN